MDVITIVVVSVVWLFIFEVYLLCFKRAKYPIMGYLRVDRSDPDDPPYLFLELKNVSVETISRQKFVTFEVKNEDFVPHK